MEFNKSKFNTLVHYVCYRAEQIELGATKLNKILWFSDVAAYVINGEPITGEVYVKREHGPVPSHILPALEDLRIEDKVVTREADYFGYNKREYIALKKPDLSDFSAEQISLVDEFINAICRGHTAKSISDLTHNKAWQLAAIGEEIPYYTVYSAGPATITEEDLAWAHQSMAEGNLCF